MHAPVNLDAFGNEIDPIVGYARGTILSTDADFHRKIQQAHRHIRVRADAGGAFHVLTGNRADFPLGAGDLGLGCDGWVGPAVPVEATALLGLLLLAEHGIVTVNALSEAGARPSVRLKPTLDAVPALGGADRLAEIVDDAISRASTMLRDVEALRAAILGAGHTG